MPASAPSSPVKNRAASSVLKAVASSSVARAADSIFTASRSYDDRSKSTLIFVLFNCQFILLVPVYDGRARNGWAPFMFTDKDFSSLSSRPLYRKGTGEIPLDSVRATAERGGLKRKRGQTQSSSRRS